jgi:hypothetical protein
LLRLLCGEAVGVRVPGAKNVSVKNKAPFFYSGLVKIAPVGGTRELRAAKNQAMDERFAMRLFATPIPHGLRLPAFPSCGRCFARFCLTNDAAFHARATAAAPGPAGPPGGAAGPGPVGPPVGPLPPAPAPPAGPPPPAPAGSGVWL